MIQMLGPSGSDSPTSLHFCAEELTTRPSPGSAAEEISGWVFRAPLNERAHGRLRSGAAS